MTIPLIELQYRLHKDGIPTASKRSIFEVKINLHKKHIKVPPGSKKSETTLMQ